MSGLEKVVCAHILVAQKFEAEDIQRKLGAGESFSSLANFFSMCSSRSAGGNLGEIRRGQTVDAFEEVAFSLKVEEISGIVRTRFGYHLIQRLS